MRACVCVGGGLQRGEELCHPECFGRPIARGIRPCAKGCAGGRGAEPASASPEIGNLPQPAGIYPFNVGPHRNRDRTERKRMNRDMDLVRQILLAAESHEGGYVGGNPSIDGYSEDQIGYHVYLMEQAGLVEAADSSADDSTSPSAILLSIKGKGHDFLDAAKSNSVWSQAKERAKSVGGSLTFDLMKELLVTTARSQLGLT